MVCLDLHGLHISSYSFPNVLVSSLASYPIDHQTGIQMLHLCPFAGAGQFGLGSNQSIQCHSIVVHCPVASLVQRLVVVAWWEWVVMVVIVVWQSPYPVVVALWHQP